jgi:membrane-bound lytic murein transglycosylase D
MRQFVRVTGGQYGLSVGNGQDDRFDPEKATRAAAKHLHDLYRQTGDWYLAMAGYNCGPLCVERAVQRTGYADFWELCRRNALPQQTQNYVPAIVAMAIIAKDPSAYDMPDVEQDPALEFDTVHLATPTHLALLADAAGTPVSELRELNPALLKDVTPPEADVHVPKGQTQTVLSALDVVPADKRTSWRLHRISAGDSLAQIARSYGVSSSALLSANAKLGPEWFDKPRVGDLVVVPVTPKLAVQKSGKGRHGGLKAHRGNSKATLSHGKRAGAKHKAPAHSTRLTGTGQPKARRAAQR